MNKKIISVILSGVIFTLAVAKAVTLKEINGEFGKMVPTLINNTFKIIEYKKIDNLEDFQIETLKNLIPYFHTLRVKIEGEVRDTNGHPIKNAVVKIEQIRNQRGESYPTEVTVKKDEWSVSTNANGKYSIDDIPAVWPLRLALCFIREKEFPSNLRITFSAEGYEKKTIDASSINKTVVYLSANLIPVLKRIGEAQTGKKLKINYEQSISSQYINDSVIINAELKKK